MSFSWSFLDLNIVLRRPGWLFETKLSIVFFSDGCQKTLRVLVQGLFQVEETQGRQTHADRVAGEEHGSLNCEAKAEGNCETQQVVSLSLEAGRGSS